MIQILTRSIEIFISYPDPEERICPKCGSLNCVIKDRRVQTVHHVPLNKTGTALTFKRIRFRCKDCDATFSDTPYWLHPSLHMTTDLYLSIWVDLTDMHSKKDIALNNCVTVSIVESVINELSFDRPTTLPQTLCIDEFKGSSGIWNPYRRKWEKDRFHFNISNGDNGSVIDILPRMDKPYLLEYFRQFPLSERQKVLFVTCDMHGGYISLAKDMFPNVTICVDMFHIIKLLNSKIDSIRNALQKELLSKDDEETYKTLKNSRRMLLTAEDNQETYWKWKLERRKERIEELLQLSPDLREVYEALQSFHQIVRTEKYSTQRLALTEWIQKYCSSEVPEVRSAANTIKFHRNYIQNSFKYQKSNGPCEGLNNKIKVLRRNAYGFHSFEEFRKRIRLPVETHILSKKPHTLKDRKGAVRS